MNIGASPSRLGFVAAARSTFDFLLQPPYSLWLTDQDEERIGYEGDDLAVVVFHDRLSYELGVHFWRPSHDEEAQRPYTLSDLMRPTAPATARSYRRFAATSVDGVIQGTEKLASELRQYGDTALRGSTELFERLIAARADAIQEFGREVEDRNARRQAEDAWGRRDYAAVVAAYAPVDDRLSRVEQERLRLSQQRSAQ